MSVFDGLDAYCERTDPSAFAEPLNVITCLAFFLAAWLLLQRGYPMEARRAVRRSATMLGLVGVTSAYSHIVATVGASWLDAGMILAFIVVFVFQYTHHVLRGGGMTVFGVLFGLVLLTRIVDSVGTLPLNGSQVYVAPWIMLGGFAWSSRHIAPSSARWLRWATVVFGFALVMRTIDLAVCNVFPLGTHFLWHILNAAVLYMCVRGLAEGCHESSGWY